MIIVLGVGTRVVEVGDGRTILDERFLQKGDIVSQSMP